MNSTIDIVERLLGMGLEFIKGRKEQREYIEEVLKLQGKITSDTVDIQEKIKEILENDIYETDSVGNEKEIIDVGNSAIAALRELRNSTPS